MKYIALIITVVVLIFVVMVFSEPSAVKDSGSRVNPRSAAGGGRVMPNMAELGTPRRKLPTKDEIRERQKLPEIPLTNVTEISGISFVHERGVTEEHLFPETVGSGCAILDLNDDGLPDLLFVNSTRWPWDQSQDQSPAFLSAWMNQGEMKFQDVTEELGLKIEMYGMGVAVGDFDNDDDSDIYLTAVGSNVLLRNDDGRFVDVTEGSGTAGTKEAWSTSAGWFDYDNDGDLDLFVGNYLTWSRELELELDKTSTTDDPRFGSPTPYEGAMPFLYRNDGNGTFTEVAESMGLHSESGKAMGIAIADVDADNWMDIFVANDAVGDQLFVNKAGKTFESAGVKRGIAFNTDGAARAGMGIDVGWQVDSSGPTMIVGNYENEMCGFYLSRDGWFFRDEAPATGLGDDTRLPLTWDIRWADMDLDGRLDILAANGHVEESDVHMRNPGRYLQAPLFFWNAGRTIRQFLPFDEKECGPDFFEPVAGRAFGLADFDNDGDLDIALTSSGSPARIFRNDLDMNDRNWLRVRVVGNTSNRDGIGAMVTLKAQGGTQRRLVSSARGYLTSAELRVTFGLGWVQGIESLEVKWPDGAIQQVEVSDVNREYVVEQQAANESAAKQADAQK